MKNLQFWEQIFDLYISTFFSFHFISCFPTKKNWNLKSKSISESDWSERFDADIAPPSQNLFIPEFYYYFLFLNFFCYFFIRIESVKSAEEWICRDYLPTPFFEFQQTVSNQISTFIFSFFSEIFLIHALPSFEKFNKAKKQKQKSKKKTQADISDIFWYPSTKRGESIWAEIFLIKLLSLHFLLCSL